MRDWAELLSPDKLGLDDPTLVERVEATETTTMEGDPLVDVKVVLNPRIQFKDLSWPLVEPVERAISRLIQQAPAAGTPYVQFFTSEDWEAYLRGDEGQDEERDEVGDAAS